MEFIEAHAVCASGGQQWPVVYRDRDAVIAAHIEQTEKELKRK